MEPRYWYSLNQWISPLGFGCWQLIGEYYKNGKPHGWGQMGKKDAIALIHQALDNGIQLFDTAAGYGDGLSEAILGEALANSATGSDAVICTKIPLSDEEIHQQEIGEAFKNKVEASLQRLNRECIDVLLIHNPPDDLDWTNFDVKVLDTLIKQGKIRTYGVSARSIVGAHNVIDKNFGTCLEWVFHFLERRPVGEIFPKLEKVNMNFIGRSPLARGLLKSRYLESAPEFSNNDFRFNLDKNWVDWVVDSIRGLTQQGAINEDVSELALRYCITYKDLSVTIPGFKRSDQLSQAINAMNKGHLDDMVLDHLKSTTEQHYPAWA